MEKTLDHTLKKYMWEKGSFFSAEGTLKTKEKKIINIMN